MTKINFATTLSDLDGNGIKEPSKEGSRAITVGDVCCKVLDTVLNSDKEDTYKDKIHKWELMRAIHGSVTKAEPLEVTAEEVALLKDRLCESGFPLIVYGRCVEVLDPKDNKDADRLPAKRVSGSKG